MRLPNRSTYKLLTCALAVTVLLTFLPGNLSDQPVDLSGFRDGLVQIVSSIGKFISNIDINFNFGVDTKDKYKKPPTIEKVVVQVDPDKETEIKSNDEKITLKIPKGAVDKQAEIEFIQYATTGSTGMVMLNRFELNAKELDTGKVFSKFTRELEITIKHEPEELTGIDINSLRLYYLDENTRQWLPVTTEKYDSKEKTIKAKTDHFTHYGEQANPLEVGPGKVMAAQVNLHSGTATFSYPLELPPGPGGFTPKLELTYNSGSVDEMKNKQSVASWVGMGWSLHLGRISYNETDEQYSLDLNGASYEIISDDGINFRTNPEEYFTIARNAVDGNTWEVLDREGNYYRFGGTTDSEQYIEESGEPNYYRWDLNLTKDTNDNQAVVTYTRNIFVGSFSECLLFGQHVRSAYPEYLIYGNVEIHFISSFDEYDELDGWLRKDNPKTYCQWIYGIVNPAPKVMDNKKLDSIEINVNNNQVRKYSFTYNTTDRVLSGDYGNIYYAGQHTLTSITQVGADDTSELPATSFSYQDLQTYRHSEEDEYVGNPGNPASFSWAHLTSVDSGYGGSISFNYNQVPDTSSDDIWTREVVTAKTIDSGIGTTQSYSYNYTGDPQYKGNDWDQEYRGFNQVKETDAADNYTKYWFYTTGVINDKDAEKISGREYKTEWYDSEDTLLREKEYEWDYYFTGKIQDIATEWTDYDSLQPAYYFYGITISNNNNIYIVCSGDEVNTGILKYNDTGSFILKWGSWGMESGQFMDPRDVCVDISGYVYVSDYFSDSPFPPARVQKFDSSGNYVLEWGSYGTGNGQFKDPNGVAVYGNSYVYVADTYNHRIQKFDTSGYFIGKWGSQGTGNGQFKYPKGIAVDADGNVYVADSGNNRIQKFDSSGTFILKWGSQGTGNGQFNGPYSVSVGSDGSIYVVDTNNDRIQKFDSNGNFTSKWGSEGTECGEFNYPKDIAVLEDSAYVTDFSNHRIQQFTNNWAIRLQQTEETTGEKTTHTEYIYDDYGNVVSEKVHGDISTYEDDTTIWRTYFPNTTANIVSKPARERVYATIVTEDSGGSNLKSETLYYYDGNNSSNTTPPTKGMLTRVESKKDASTSVSGYTTYDSYGNVLTTTDANSNVTTLTWDATYHTYPATQTFPITGLTESYTYDPGTNNVISITDVNGLTTTYQYDTFKRATKVIKPGDTPESPSMEFQYNNWGTINQQHLKTSTKISEGNYIWQSQYFDGLGRVVQVHSNGESGHTIISGTTIFNNRGLVDKQYVTQDLLSSQVHGYYAPEAGWKYSTSTYDGLGRVLVQTNVDSTTISNDYSTPWKVAVTNSRGFISRYYYDAFGRLVKVEEPDESNGVYATTTYTYDTLGNLVQVVDANSNVTSMSYDWLSRKTAMTDPDMGSWSYDYDNNGNLISQTDAKSQTITMVYDALNRLTNKNYPQGSGMTDVVYTYDSTSGGNYGKGLRTGMTDAAGSNIYKYDTRGRLVEEKRTIDSVDYTTGYVYDGLDRVMTVTYPTGETVTNTYNGRGLPYGVSGNVAGTLVTGTLYNQLGAITEINLGNGVKTTYGYYDTGGTYDTTGGYYGRLWEIESIKDSTTLQDIQHTWDAGGNLTQRQDLVASETETFTYDFLDRLTGALGAYTQTYSYNNIGNITSTNGNSYTYGSQPHAVTQVGTTVYAYDANGNMTTRGTQTIGWDVENRVISVTGGASFIYDGDGNRVKKTENNETVVYINQYYEKNLTTGVVTTSYYLGGKLVANRVDTTVNYLHLDHLGSTSVVSDTNGTQTETIRYFPFGGIRSGSVTTDRKFTGQRLDDTGLYYYGARYYDAGIGRFISADTVVQSPGNPQTLNRYSYCLNNPLKYIDPSGHYVTIGEDESGHVIQVNSKGEVSPNGTPPAPNLPTEQPESTEPELPVEDDDNDTVVWGYADEINYPLAGYYHSAIVVQDSKGNNNLIETWGYTTSLGGIQAEIFEPGQTITDMRYTNQGFSCETGINASLIAWEANASMYYGYGQGLNVDIGDNENFYVGVNDGPYVRLAWTTVTSIKPNQIYDYMPRWVRNAYKRAGYNFSD